MQAVLKFGGAALADGSTIEACMGRVIEHVNRPGARPPVVVVSALAGVTDGLLAAAHAAGQGRPAFDALRIRHRSTLSQLDLGSELLDRHWRDLGHLLAGIAQRQTCAAAEVDLVLSFGERMSARILAAALNRARCGATPVDAWDLGFLTDSNHGHARPIDGIEQPIRQALDGIQDVAIVTGFLAKDRGGRLTTLGRNGSDLTASVLAEASGADELIFYKDVAGIHSADPQLIPSARPLDRMTYSEAAELTFQGARVLHPASVAPAVRARADVWVRPIHPGEGTRLVSYLCRTAPVALACRASAREDGYASIALVGHGLGSSTQLARAVAGSLAHAGIFAKLAQLGGRVHSQTLLVHQSEMHRACTLLHDRLVATLVNHEI